MHSVLKTFLSGALSFLLILTGQSMAFARGSSDATGQMVICTGAGPKTIYVDAKGNPTQAPHICPECTVVLTTHPLAAQGVWEASVGPALLAIVPHVSVRMSERCAGFLSRAPPVAT